MRAKILNLIQSTREGQEGDWRESGMFRVLREASNFHSNVSGLLEGTEYRSRDAKVVACWRDLSFSARGRGMDLDVLEQVSLCTWSRARIGLWICDHKAREPGLRNVTGSEGKNHVQENVSQNSFSPHLPPSSCPFLDDRCSLLFRGICHLEWKCTSSAYCS